MSVTSAIYLDYNATCPIRPEVISSVAAAMGVVGNASSIHAYGRGARKMVEDARAQVAALTGTQPRQVIFTSGATEANNMVVRGFAEQGRVLVSATEHVAVLESGAKLELLPVQASGLLDMDFLRQQLTSAEKPALVSVMWVNNETGVIQPIAEIAALCKEHNVPFHCDAVQALGRVEIDMNKLGITYMSVSAHKIGGPHGVGAVLMALGQNPPKLIQGGGQERRMRAGTENVAGIVGFGEAARLAGENMLEQNARLHAWRQQIETEITKVGGVVFGQEAPRASNTIYFALAGLDAAMMLMNFDLEKIALSSGSACSSGSVKPSYVLAAMQVDPELSKGALRLSMGWGTQQSDVDAFIAAWQKIVARLKPNAA